MGLYLNMLSPELQLVHYFLGKNKLANPGAKSIKRYCIPVFGFKARNHKDDFTCYCTVVPNERVAFLNTGGHYLGFLQYVLTDVLRIVPQVCFW